MKNKNNKKSSDKNSANYNHVWVDNCVVGSGTRNPSEDIPCSNCTNCECENKGVSLAPKSDIHSNEESGLVLNNEDFTPSDYLGHVTLVLNSINRSILVDGTVVMRNELIKLSKQKVKKIYYNINGVLLNESTDELIKLCNRALDSTDNVQCTSVYFYYYSKKTKKIKGISIFEDMIYNKRAKRWDIKLCSLEGEGECDPEELETIRKSLFESETNG